METTFQVHGQQRQKQSEQICRTWERAARVGRKGHADNGRSAGDHCGRWADVFSASNRENTPSRSVRDWCATWLDTKRVEAAPTTVSRYAGVLERFKSHLGKKADRDLASLTAADIGDFRDALSKDLFRNSANLSVKKLRVCLRAARRRRSSRCCGLSASSVLGCANPWPALAFLPHSPSDQSETPRSRETSL